MQTIFEDIRNYVNIKDKLLDLYNNKFQLKEDILYFINDFILTKKKLFLNFLYE